MKTKYDRNCGSVNGKQMKMTEDHRISSYTERLRIQETGEPLKEGETRLCGKEITSFCCELHD